MNEYFLGYAAPRSLRDYWTRARRELADYDVDVIGRTEAHSTVMKPRKLDIDTARLTRKRIRAAVQSRRVHPLYVQVGPINRFPTKLHETHVVFYLPLEGRGVREEYLRLISLFGFTPHDLEGQTPHMTVAKVPVDQLQLADRILKNVAPPPETERLDFLVWYERCLIPERPWWVASERFNLDAWQLVRA